EVTRESKTVVLMLCDLHEDEAEAEETVSFAANGMAYEMELCADHLARYNETIDAWTKTARPLTGRRRRDGGAQGAPAGRREGAGEGLDPAQVREWARGNGYGCGYSATSREPFDRKGFLT
ncbi:MAG: Lsr2 dimerization domain-containing protein, partial [Solirubrobacteraceae bacterium]